MSVEYYADRAISASRDAALAYCKFITANDVGATGGHQSGYHIHKSAWSLFLDHPGVRGRNEDKIVTIRWQDDFETESRFIYYGTHTRNEYRLTRFGRGFPFLQDDTIGSLLVICKVSEEYYRAYVLETEEDIESYLQAFHLSSEQANGIVSQGEVISDNIAEFAREFASTLASFPETAILADKARELSCITYHTTRDDAITSPDLVILQWINTEYALFRAIEHAIYASDLQSLSNLDDMIVFANTVLNRRKSRAGKSLEHHLGQMFRINNIAYTAQGITEGRRRPDFIMPSITAYHDESYESGLVFLAAKTTCKDRWRQILNEAARIPHKHLFTLQQGVSASQLNEMKSEGVTLVVPEKHLSAFPAQERDSIMTLRKFINYTKEMIC